MKYILKLFLKCVLVMLPVAFIGIYMWKNPLAFMDNETPYYLWNREKTNITQNKEYDVLFLGDSVANAAYVPEILSDRSLNLALGGTTPLENYFTLCEWLENNPAPKVCYISFMDFHLQKEINFWNRIMYSHRYHFFQNYEMMKAAIKHKESSILTDHYWLDFISYELYFPNKYITSFMNASFNQRKAMNLNLQKANELHGGRYAGKGVIEYRATDEIITDSFWTNSLFDEYYRKLIELCLDNQITVRLIKLPLPDNGIFSENYAQEFKEYYDCLKLDYPNISVKWFPPYPQELFADATHMNSHGALQFSKLIKETYPEDFREVELSNSQILAINDDIKEENKIEWILRWIEEKNYLVLFYDARGSFKLQELSDQKIKIDGKRGRKDASSYVICVEGRSGNSKGLMVSTSENGFLIRDKDGNVLEWGINDENKICVLIIDNYNHNAVCMKTFRYADEEFILEK